MQQCNTDIKTCDVKTVLIFLTSCNGVLHVSAPLAKDVIWIYLAAKYDVQIEHQIAE